MSTMGAAKAAEILFWAGVNRMRLQRLSANLVPQNLDQAYEIQAAATRLRRMATAAFKVGLTSLKAQRATGAAEPIAGRLTASDILRSPARISVRESDLRIVEAEVVFELGQDLPASKAPFTDAEVAKSIGAAFAAIEICNSRFRDVDDLSLAEIVADNSNADLIVVGERLTSLQQQALAGLSVTLARRGQPVIHGSTADVLGHPLKSVTWLANWLAARGEGLRRGQLIASGSCTGMAEVATNDVVVAMFGTEAQVSVEFAPAGVKSEVTP
jgi:2-keto-4-pentenoate hydratase